MAIRFTESAARHGISQRDAMYAIGHASGAEEVAGHPGDVTTMYVGRPHAQSDRYLEVGVAETPTDVVIFHAMELTDLYRHLLHERTDDER